MRGRERVGAAYPPLREQRLRVDQVLRLESLREPPVHAGQHRVRLGPLALPEPEPREARRGAELETPGLLALRDLDRLMKVAPRRALRGSTCGLGLARGPENDLSLQPVELRVPVAKARSLAEGQGLGDGRLRFLGAVEVAADLRQDAEERRPSELGADHLIHREALSDPIGPLLLASLLGEQPASIDLAEQ